MEQINAYGFYLLGKWLDSTFLSATWPIKDNFRAWHAARGVLSMLLEGDVKVRLNESAPAGRRLLAEIDGVLTDFAANPELMLAEDRVRSFHAAWGAFEQAVQVDLSRAPIYFVTTKGIYATDFLINGAEFAFVPEVYEAISPAARADINQAGRCLAFGTWTASGFHALRATEKVLREYYEVTLNQPGANVMMARAIDELRRAGAEAKTLAALDQLRDLHRNPLSHPEVFLTKAEAMELFNICIGAISASARQIITTRAAAAPPAQ